MKKIIVLVGLLAYIPSLFAASLLDEYGHKPYFNDNDIRLVSQYPTCGAVTIKPKGSDEIHVIAKLVNGKERFYRDVVRDTGGGYIPNTGLRIKYDWASEKEEGFYYRIECSKDGKNVRCADFVTLENIEHNYFCPSISASYSPLGMDKG